MENKGEEREEEKGELQNIHWDRWKMILQHGFHALPM